jgi:hypothetical protein
MAPPSAQQLEDALDNPTDILATDELVDGNEESDATKTEPLSVAEQVELANALDSFNTHLCNGKVHRIGSGRALKVIKRLWSKAGKSFKQNVKSELHIAYMTANDWMKEADAADSAAQTALGTCPVPSSPGYPDDADKLDPVAEAIKAEQAKIGDIHQDIEDVAPLKSFRPRFGDLPQGLYDALAAKYKILPAEERTKRYCASMEVTYEDFIA